MLEALRPPKCSCSSRSIGDRVFTCPICCRAALRRMAGEVVDQGELFAYVDRPSSVSAPRSRSELTPIADVLRSLAAADGLPF